MNDHVTVAVAATGQQPPNHHQRTKSSVLRAFGMHRRANSQGDGLAAAPLTTTAAHQTRPLEELSLNHQAPGRPLELSFGNPQSKAAGAAARSPERKATQNHGTENTPMLSPSKKARTRSTTNLGGFLSRPKSLKNLYLLASREAAEEAETTAKASGPDGDRERGRSGGGGGLGWRDREARDKKRDKSRHARGNDGDDVATRNKENQAPTPAASRQTTPPIYAQFCSTGSSGSSSGSSGAAASASSDNVPLGTQHTTKPRPMSYHPGSSRKPQTPSGSSGGSPTPMDLDPKDIETHLEALLDRRNIPEHQRYKMRNLTDTIKMEFIRQDWAEERAKRPLPLDTRPSSHDSGNATRSGPDTPTVQAGDGADGGASTSTRATPAAKTTKTAKSGHSRGKSLTLSKVVARGRSRERGDATKNNSGEKRHKSPGSPLKRRFETGTLGRHLRSKSTESIVLRTNSNGERDPAGLSSSSVVSSAGSSSLTSLFAKAAGVGGPPQHTPADFVAYLRTVRAPEQVEVGKLHKLRLLLRNETVAWTEAFIGQGGMEEVVSLLYRILAVEWREEHEDALLHETLLCLKALCTTALALQYLHTIHDSLLPALIHMLFDPEKKGPSEFTTRTIVTWVLLAYIQRAPADERAQRAQTVLRYLRDPAGGEAETLVPFVLEMRRDRPYRVWCKEVVSVTKEVFWIFLHHLNVVSLERGATAEGVVSDQAYMERHFPQERPPVPAAPYVGGVEWEATNYLASHLDLVNALVACTPTAAARNGLRAQMQMSGWERCMGGSLRLCKEKFYGAVHDGLRTWVAAAQADGWAVGDVRYGPASDAAGGPGAAPAAPRLEMPQLDFILDGEGL